jgi:hypothetical protein
MNERLDLLLVYPPWPAAKGRARLISTLPPLGVLSIAANVEQHGYTVQVCDAHAEQLDDLEVRHLIRQLQPKYVGLSVLTSQALAAHAIARIIKEEVPDCIVIAGGVHAEAMPVRMLRNSAIDVVIRGDGEEAMVEVLDGKPISEITGASHRIDDTVVHNPARSVQMDLDVYPMPAYHMVNFDLYYPGATTYRQLPAINLLMTRGCPGKCTFCNSAKTTLRSRSPASMVEQIKHLYHAYGIRQFQFYDDTFTVLKKNCLEFCALLAAENLDVSWIGFIRGDCFSDKIAAAMKPAAQPSPRESENPSIKTATNVQSKLRTNMAWKFVRASSSAAWMRPGKPWRRALKWPSNSTSTLCRYLSLRPTPELRCTTKLWSEGGFERNHGMRMVKLGCWWINPKLMRKASTDLNNTSIGVFI